MFTGLVEEIGILQAVRRGSRSAELTIGCRAVLEGSGIGDSIAVNGVCLTVTSLGGTYFTADVMPETLDRSSLGSLSTGSSVNLERAMPADGRFGGHIVSGHIDGTGRIESLRRDDNAVWYTISAGPAILRYIVEKGSITIDGISLTVAAVSGSDFSVSIIPHTQQVTALKEKHTGSIVNLECDIIGKYVEKLLFPYALQAGGSDNSCIRSSGNLSGSLSSGSFGVVSSGSSGGDSYAGLSGDGGAYNVGAYDTGGSGAYSAGGQSTSSGGLTEEFLRSHGF